MGGATTFCFQWRALNIGGDQTLVVYSSNGLLVERRALVGNIVSIESVSGNGIVGAI